MPDIYEVLGSASLGIIDVSDGLVTTSGEPPSSYTTGTLWIDESTDPPSLKVYRNGQWEIVKLDVNQMDDDLKATVERILASLSAFADDGFLDFSERKDILMELANITGVLLSTRTTLQGTMPAWNTLDSTGVGTFASMRQSYRDATGETSDSVYVDLQQKYTDLANYLQGITPKPWNVRENNKDEPSPIDNPDVYRVRFLDYYMAELELAKETERLAKKAQEDYTDEVVDGIEVGGRNLIVESDIEHGYYFLNEGELVSESGRWTTGKIDVISGAEYTFSTNGKSAYLIVGFWDDNDEIILPRYVNTSTNVNTVTLVAPINASYTRMWSENFDAGYFKIERGNKATDWTPAPEDVKEDIENVERVLKSDIEQTASNIRASIRDITNDLDQYFDFSIDGLTIGSSGSNARILASNNRLRLMNGNTAVFDVNSSTGEVQLNVSKLTIGALDIEEELENRATKEALENIEFGGRNLLRNSDFSDGLYDSGVDRWQFRGTEGELTSDGNLLIKSGVGSSGNRDIVIWTSNRESFPSGSYLTMTFKLKSDTDNTILIRLGSSGRGSGTRRLNIEPEMRDYSVSFPINTSSDNNRAIVFWLEQAGEIEIDRVKLEKGNKATDWTEAPEDTDAKINDKADNTTVSELDEALSNLETVTATREELGEVLSTLNDYKDMLEANEIDVNDAKDDISNLLGRVPAIENNLGEFVERWNFLDTTVAMGEEGLMIGEVGFDDANEPFIVTGVRVHAEGIDFVQSEEIIANITGQVLRINRGIFVDSAQIGQHKIETIAGGHTIWQWMN